MNIKDLPQGSYTPVVASTTKKLNIKDLPTGSYTPIVPTPQKSARELADIASAEKYGATFQTSTEKPSPLREAAKTVGNIPSSAWGFAKGTLDILNPLSTARKIAEIGKGFGEFAEEAGGAGQAFKGVAKETPKALYEGLVPELGRTLIAGDTEEAQRAVVHDPVGQILPFILGARGGAKVADTAATRSAMAEYAKAPYTIKTIPKPITKYGEAFDTGVTKVTGAVTKPIGAVAGKVGEYAKGMAESGVSQMTGLGKETVSRVTAFPEAFTKKSIAETDRASLGQKVQSELAKLSEEKIATGKEYGPIRASGQQIKVDGDFFSNTIKETTGLDIKKGQLVPSGTSKLRDAGDVRAVQRVYDFWNPYFKKGVLTADEFLNMREDLAKMAKFEKDIGVRKDVQTLSGIMRAKFNEAYRPQVGGLKELDTSMSSQLKEFKELTKGLVDKEGNMTDAGMAKIANLSANKPNLAIQLEKIVPGITEQIKNLQAITDIERASGIKAFKTGPYVRGALTGGAFLGAGVPAGVLTMILTDPAIAVPLLRQYGLLKNSRAVNTVINALKQGATDINQITAGVPKPLQKGVGETYTDINKTMAGKGGLSMQDVSKTATQSFNKEALFQKNLFKYKTHDAYMENKYDGFAKASGVEKLGIGDSTIKWIDDWFSAKQATPSATIAKQLEKYKPQKPTTIYSGNSQSELNLTRTKPMSFTTDINVAKEFGSLGRRDNPAIIKIENVKPLDMVVEIDSIPKAVLKALGKDGGYIAGEHEIVTNGALKELSQKYNVSISSDNGVTWKSMNPKTTLGKPATAPKATLGKPVSAPAATEATLEKLKLTDAYPDNFLGYNLKYLEKVAKEKGYNLYDKMIKLVDSQETTAGKIKGMESIMNDLFSSKTNLGK